MVRAVGCRTIQAIATAVVFASGVSTAVAQDARPQVPRSALPDIRVPQLPGPEAPEPPAIQVPEGLPSAAPAEAEAIRFTLNDVAVEGATAYPPDHFSRFYQNLLGTEVSVADMYRVADAIERGYRADGYFLTRVIVPAQSIDHGVFRIQVVEGFIDGTRIEGDFGPSRSLVEGYLSQVVDRRPLTLADLERALLLVNDIPGITAKGLLRPSKATPGAAELVVSVDRKPFDGLLNVDNYGTRYTGFWEVAGTAAANSFTPFGENIAITGLLSDPSEGFHDAKNQWVGQINSTWRFGSQGFFSQALFSYGRSRPGFNIEQFDFESDTLLFTLAGGYPFIRTRDLTVTGRLGFDLIDSDTDVFGGDKFIRDRIRMLHLSGSAEFLDTWRGVNTVGAGIRQGIDIFNATQKGEFYKSRDDASNQVTILEASASRLQPLYDGFTVFSQPSAVDLFASVAGQFAPDPVLAYEEFEVGSLQYGLGYDLGELSGDSGVGLLCELRFNQRISNIPYLNSYQLFTFGNLGQVWNEGGGPDDYLASVGGGLRLFVADAISVEFIGAQPLHPGTERDASSNDTPAQYGHSPQFLFRTYARF
ncbi:MAG: ShlB/FhaC/HecB family hemolysin secretion/activation protein [Rhodospirillales bacterium]|nr:ShlB/FhaC/HecB family hemolysin secretion/activation protein [Rhodospirillales bacterium]